MCPLILLLACAGIQSANAAAGDTKESAIEEQTFLPYALPQAHDTATRYALLAESKEYEEEPLDENLSYNLKKGITTNKPRRRLALGYGSTHQYTPAAWHTASPLTPSFGALAPLISLPGLLVIGVNLGALLYMVLGVLGLGLTQPPRIWPIGHTAEFYRNERQYLTDDRK